MSGRRTAHPPHGKRKVGAIEGSMMTFVVRLTRDKAGRFTGVVEKVKTGRKARIDGLEAIGRAIADMIAGSSTDDTEDWERGGQP